MMAGWRRMAVAALGVCVATHPDAILHGQNAGADPHRPVCEDPRCQKIKSFLKTHYCGESPFGDGPDDGCEILKPKPPRADNDVIAHFNCKWLETQGSVCQQFGQIPSPIHASLIRELRRIGLPAAEDRLTYFTVEKSKATGWFVAEGFYARRVASDVTLCQVIVMIAPTSQVFVLRELPFQKADVDVPAGTTWSLLDLTDVDGDGMPDLILRGDAYEDHWFEVYSVQNGSPHMIFSGLGYYL
jgi:hypothetical protein